MDSFLRTITLFGAQQRYAAISTAVKAKLEEELALIEKLGFSGYFLIVWDIVNFCREHNIMVQGRGSAANSAVCFCLGITPVDPVSNHLVFERFLKRTAKAGPTSISICRAATGARASSRKFTGVTANTARP